MFTPKFMQIIRCVYIDILISGDMNREEVVLLCFLYSLIIDLW